MRMSSFDAPANGMPPAPSPEISATHASPAPASSAPASSALPSLAMIPRALLVCIDVRLRDQLARAASEMGCAFHHVDSAEAALRQLAQQPQDLAVIDLDLRSGAGADLLGVIRQRWSWVQMILLGGVSEDDSTRHAIRFGVSEFLSKPCSQREIVSAMTRAYRKRVQEMGMIGPSSHVASPHAASSHVASSHAPLSNSTAAASAAPTSNGARGATVALPASINSAVSALASARASSLGEIERVHILAALERNRGNREIAAAELGISVRKLYYRLQQYHRDGLIA